MAQGGCSLECVLRRARVHSARRSRLDGDARTWAKLMFHRHLGGCKLPTLLGRRRRLFPPSQVYPTEIMREQEESAWDSYCCDSSADLLVA
jgi:hypothetical protein